MLTVHQALPDFSHYKPVRELNREEFPLGMTYLQRGDKEILIVVKMIPHASWLL